MLETIRRATADVPSSELDVVKAELVAERALLDGIARIAPLLASELDGDRLMQRLTDEATAIVGAQFGAFFYNVTRATGESYMLYTLSGAPREAFDKFGMPRNTQIFAPTFAGNGVVRSDDIRSDPRYGKNPPHQGMPTGHLPVVSYLAVPVRSMTGAVLGGLFFGHPERAVFGDREERAVLALSGLAGPALDNARLFRTLGQREADLQAANTRYRLVTEATREGIWFWDIASDTVQWNEALLTAMGIGAAEWGGRFEDWFSRIHPDDQPVLALALREHLEHQKPYSLDVFRLLHSCGEYRWFTTVGQAEWDADGKPLRMAGSLRDITEKKLAEDALRASRHRYAQILDSVGDMVFCKNENLTIVYANAATCRYYRMNAEELRSITDVPCNEIDFTKQYNADDREVFVKGEPVERHEEPNAAPDGSVRYFHTVKTPVFDEAGRVVELVGVARDITERKRASELLQKLAAASELLGRAIEYEETLANLARAMVPNAADWCAIDIAERDGLRRIAVAHRDPRKVTLAEELEQRYPASPDAAHGVSAVVRSGRPELMRHIDEALLVELARDEHHLALIRSLGLASYIIVPLLGQDRVLGAITLVSERRDFDEQDLAFAEELARRASAALENALLYREVRSLNATLERRVEERTAELLEANKELEAFSYTVSHDLRAPIRHIGGFIDLLRAYSVERLDEKALRYVDIIKQSATQMGTLIDELLAFSRLGRAAVTKQSVSLHDVLSEVRGALEPEIAGREIVWRVGALPTVGADPLMLRQVLINLVGNAVKYTRNTTHPVIEVRAEVRGSEDTICISDNGPGFNMEYAHKLFGVFQRLHSDSEFEGTGIGLATVRRIVNRHGGRVWAEAVPGEGARFYFTLPRGELG